MEPSKTFVEVGKWTGLLFFWLWYADIYACESDKVPFVSINAMTKRGAIRKSKRYIRRANMLRETLTYIYDDSTQQLIEIS